MITQHKFKQGIIDRLVSEEVFTINVNKTGEEIGIEGKTDGDGNIQSVQWWRGSSTHALVFSDPMPNHLWPTHLLSSIVDELDDPEMKRMRDAIVESEKGDEE